MKRFLTLFLALSSVALMGLASAAHADQPAFFSALNDIPAMPGLYEAPERHMIFDVPEGRIVELAIVPKNLSRAAIENYYRQTLPQFGWHIKKENSYIRDGEQLDLFFENQNLLKISVSPL